LSRTGGSPVRINSATLITAGLLLAVFNSNWSYLGVPLPVDRLVLVCGVLSAALGDREWRRPPIARAATAVLLLAALYAILSAIWAGTLLQNTPGFRLLDRFGLVPFAAFAVAPWAYRRQRDREVLLAALVALGAYLGLTTLFEVIGPHALVFPRYILDPHIGYQGERGRGPFVESEANGAAMFACAVAAAIAIRTWRGTKSRLFAGGTALVCILGCMLTLSRGVWLGAALGTLVAMAAFRELRPLLVPTLVGAAIAIGAAFLLVPGLLATASQRAADQTTLWDRENLDRAALNMFAARPLLGFGWGEFQLEDVDYFRQAGTYPLTSTNGTLVHSVFLSNLVELGAIGTLLWLVATVLALGGPIVSRSPSEARLWRAGLLALVTSWAVLSNVTPLAQSFPVLIVWLWAGIVVAQLDGSPAGMRPHPQRGTAAVELRQRLRAATAADEAA
jgi:putative inorganic carbon (hco3(-)) transporter